MSLYICTIVLWNNSSEHIYKTNLTKNISKPKKNEAYQPNYVLLDERTLSRDDAMGKNLIVRTNNNR